MYIKTKQTKKSTKQKSGKRWFRGEVGVLFHPSLISKGVALVSKTLDGSQSPSHHIHFLAYRKKKME